MCPGARYINLCIVLVQRRKTRLDIIESRKESNQQTNKQSNFLIRKRNVSMRRFYYMYAPKRMLDREKKSLAIIVLQGYIFII